MQISLDSPPLPDQLEVSVFGPGKGESIVVHLGDGRWMIVDSCVDVRSRSTPKPIPALDYLESMGVNLGVDVAMVVATHAHDDHFKGISRIYDRCSSAFFVCSDAQSTEEFRALIDLDGAINGGLRVSAYEEFRRVFQTARARRSAMAGHTLPIKLTGQDRELFRSTDTGALPELTVRALTPSDEAKARATRAFGAVLPTAGSNRHMAPVDPNELCIALWIESASRAILLGADLTNGPAGCGWGAVLATFSPRTRASLFKVPHHGSPNAHHDGVWDDLLSERPVALLAPFRGSSTFRPSPDDERRILGRTDLSFGTALTKLPSASAQVKRARQLLRGVALDVRDPWGAVGHIRARASLTDDGWMVETYGPAYQLPSAEAEAQPA